MPPPCLPSSSPSNLPVLVTGYAQTTLSPIFTPEVQYWGTRILAWSAEFGLDPNLAATVMQIESCGYEHAVSRSGAIGLFQVMPFHFSESDCPLSTPTPMPAADWLTSPCRSSAPVAIRAWHWQATTAGSASSPAANQAGQPKLMRYVYYGAPIYADAVAGFSTSNAVSEWYLKYGVSLCNQARMSIGLP